ncbi:MAG: hypothetical protein ACRCX2_34625 [Paraclostridium sp.]
MKIKIVGIYTGSNDKGTVIGGVPFMPKVENTAFVDEATYKNLLVAVKNGWFSITRDDYNKFLEKRGILAQKFVDVNLLASACTAKDEVKAIGAKVLTEEEASKLENKEQPIEKKEEVVVEKKKVTRKTKKTESTEE